ncbi:MAG: CBS domain-containing protein [Deferrisomatales bacterium]|nr:CBS domain-containing protein [Deferrisomatales bacterium]
MKVSELLRKKKTQRVFTCSPDDSIQRVAQLVTEHRVGALPVTDPMGKLLGILSERDLARALAERGDQAAGAVVADFMTRDVTVMGPGDSLRDAMRTMGRLSIRHLPVIQGGALLGVLSQRDVLKAVLDDAQLEIGVLRDVALSRS